MIEIGFWPFVLISQFAVLGIILSVGIIIYLRRMKKKRGQQMEVDGQVIDSTTSESARTETLAQRIKNLEKFREKYFDVKRLYESMLAAYKNLQDAIEENLSEDDQAKLKEALDKVTQEKMLLESELSIIEEALESVVKGGTPVKMSSGVLASELGGSAKRVDSSISKVQSVIQEQKASILELKSRIKDLKLEVNESKAVEEAFDELQRKYREMEDAIEILQDENEFLQDQIQALLKMDIESKDVRQEPVNESGDARVLQLQKELAEKQKAYDQLYDKFTQIEAEYLKLEEEAESRKAMDDTQQKTA